MLDLSDAVLIDLEATGPDPAQDRITSLALLPYDDVYRTPGLPFAALVNPGRPIPPKVAALTGLTDATVADAPPFGLIAERVAELVRGRPLVGFGVTGFDVPLLAEEFERAGVDYAFGPVIDAGVIFKKHEARTLTAAVQFYLGKELASAHDARADAYAAGQVLTAQLNRYALTAKTLDELAALSVLGEHPPADPFGKLVTIDGRVCFNTHRNRHVPVEHDLGYAHWMLRSDFPEATLRVLRAELDRIERTPTEGERLEDAVAAAMAGDEVAIPF